MPQKRSKSNLAQNTWQVSRSYQRICQPLLYTALCSHKKSRPLAYVTIAYYDIVCAVIMNYVKVLGVKDLNYDVNTVAVKIRILFFAIKDNVLDINQVSERSRVNIFRYGLIVR